jgi:uncharacterized membrane protein
LPQTLTLGEKLLSNKSLLDSVLVSTSLNLLFLSLVLLGRLVLVCIRLTTLYTSHVTSMVTRLNWNVFTELSNLISVMRTEPF